MNKLRQKLLACAVLGLMASPAMAIPVTFQFSQVGFSTESAKTYTDSSGLEVEVTASWSGSRTSLTSNDSADVSLNGGYGLGVLNDWENGYPRDEYAVDGVNVFDRLTFEFTESVTLISAEFYYYGSNTNFTLFSGPDTATQFDAYTDKFFTPTTPDHGYVGLAGLDLYSDLFGFGAGESETTQICFGGWGCIDKTRSSKFKLISLKVETRNLTPPPPEVPLPASLPLFGTGLALMGYLGMRRRKKANA